MGRELAGLTYDGAARKIWRIEVATADGQPQSYTARHVVISAPATRIGPHTLPPTPISLSHARELRYRDFLTVALMINSSMYSTTTGSISMTPA